MNKKLEIAKLESDVASIESGIKAQEFRIVEAEDNIERLKLSLESSFKAKKEALDKLTALKG